MGVDWELFTDYLSADQPLINTLHRFESRLVQNPQFVHLLAKGAACVHRQDEVAALRCIAEAQALLDSNAAAELIPLLFFATVLPETLALLRTLGLSDDTIRDTLFDFQRWSDVYRTNNQGSYGFDRQRWMMHHFCGHLVQLGRLQFQVDEFRFPFTFFACKESEELHCVASAGLEIDESGHLAGTNGVVSKTLMTENTTSDGFLTAHAVDLDAGTVLPKPITLDLRELKILVQPDTPVLHIHIPVGGTLDDSVVSESIDQARRFFDSWEVRQEIMVCDSWLLDPALAGFLPKEGNICKFMRRFVKFPVFRDRPQIYERVFGAGFDPSLLSIWPCTTSLQRNLQGFLLRGGTVYTTGGLLLH